MQRNAGPGLRKGQGIFRHAGIALGDPATFGIAARNNHFIFKMKHSKFPPRKNFLALLIFQTNFFFHFGIFSTLVSDTTFES